MSQQMITVGCTVSDRTWVDVPTPSGPDVQVRWAGHVGSPDASGPTRVTLEWRVKPSVTELEASGITREESDAGRDGDREWTGRS